MCPELRHSIVRGPLGAFMGMKARDVPYKHNAATLNLIAIAGCLPVFTEGERRGELMRLAEEAKVELR